MSQEPEINVNKIVVWSIIILLAIMALFQTIVIVGAGHRAVVTRLGKVTDRVMGEGMHAKIPFIEGVWKVEVRVQKEEVDTAAASKDMQEVRARLAVNYHLEPDKVQWIYQNLGIEFKDRIIDPAIQESFKAVAAQFDASQLLQERPKVKEVAKQILVDRLHKNHIIVDDLSIVNFDFSAEFNKAIEQKQVAQQQAEQAHYKLETSKKEAEAIKIQAEALNSNPELVQWEAVKKWDGKMPQYTGGNMIPFIGQINK